MQTKGTHMVELDPLWQNIIFAAFAMTEVGGGVVLFVRTYLTQRAYLRHFAGEYPFLAGEPLFDTPRTFRAYRLVSRLMHEQQFDPALEQLRRELWRRNRLFIVWIPAFPIAFFGVVALLILTGVVTLTGTEQQPPSGLQGITVSQTVLAILQIAAFVCGLAASLLANVQYGRFVRILSTALFMGVLGVLAILAGTVPQGPGIPILLVVVGFIVAAFTPLEIRVGKLTANQMRAIGYLLSFLSLLAQFVVDIVGIKFV